MPPRISTPRRATGRGRRSAAAAGIAVAAALVAWGAWTMGADAAGRWTAAIEETMHLERVLARQRLEVAKVQGSPMADFDGLMHAGRELERLVRTVLARGEGLSEDGEDAGRMLVAFARTVEAQGEQVERYKTGHAVMRNSTRFLPDAVQEAAGSVRKAGQTGLARHIEHSERRLRAWMESPDAVRRRQAVEALDQVRSVADSAGVSAFAGKVRQYVAHADVLLKHRDGTAEHLADATAEHSGAFEEVLAELRARRTETQARMTGALTAVAAGGLALAGLAGCAIVPGSGLRRTQRRRQGEAEREGRHEATDLEQVLNGMLRLYAQIDEQAEPPDETMGNDSKGVMATGREAGARASPERSDTPRPESIIRFFRARPAHPADTSTTDAAEVTSKIRSDPR
ncbi:MAG: hypothetical protein F4169_19805 [Gammaproteobacteria bacterium]|nr:hypothetical protein [Gemmatimonadota bacterium]MYF31051.1 hypothetical protein [Gammaproteobacteria bacterium]